MKRMVMELLFIGMFVGILFLTGYMVTLYFLKLT